MNTITHKDVADAAAAHGVGILQALNMMQGACAKLGDTQSLEMLCAIKSEILFGDE